MLYDTRVLSIIYVLRAYTCINVSKKSAQSKTNLRAAYLGRYSFFAVFDCIDDKSRQT